MTNSQDGIDLGLYISKNIIEAQGGRIWAENNVEGSGATFSFALPVAEIDFSCSLDAKCKVIVFNS